MRYKFVTTGPFVLNEIDNSDAKYLRLTFDDGHTRKLAKGGNWPPEYAIACLEKAESLFKKPVYIKTSQTTKNWRTTEWLCDLKPAEVAEQASSFALELRPNHAPESNDSIDKYMLVSMTSGKTFYANVEPVADYFEKEDDFLDFSNSFEKGFVSAWTAKTARQTKLPPGVRRVRIAGLGQATKRNGFRVVAAEVQTENTSEAFRFFHILRIDSKSEHEDYLSDAEIRQVTEAQQHLSNVYPIKYLSMQ